MVVLQSPPVVLTCLVAQERQKKIWKVTRGKQLEAGVISHLNNRAKDGGLKNNNGGITEVEEGTGGTLENRVVGGQMVQRINRAGREDGRGLEEGMQVAGEDNVKGEETGFRETQYLEVGVVVGETEVEATLMREPPGVIWKKGDHSEEDGEEEMQVEANPTRTGGVPSPTQQQHRYQTAKWHQ